MMYVITFFHNFLSPYVARFFFFFSTRENPVSFLFPHLCLSLRPVSPCHILLVQFITYSWHTFLVDFISYR